MRATTLLIVCCVLVPVGIFAVRSAQQGADYAGPHAVVDSLVCDLGEQPRGERLVAELLIRNTGSRRLIVTREAAMCCGNNPVGEQLVIYPGETQTLAVELDTVQSVGQLVHEEWIVTNDPDLPRFSVRVLASIVETLRE